VTQHVSPASLTPHQAIPAASASRWLGLTVTLTGAFMAIMDAFIVIIALPSIRADLHASFGEAQLVAAAYGLTYAVGLITGGRLGDLYGRKRMFMAGLGAFTLASLGCGLAPTPGVLIAASGYVKAMPDSIARWLPRPMTALGTDGYGRSETRAALREFFEVDYRYVIVATLAALAREGTIDASVVEQAIKAHNVNPEKTNPATS